jgi:hypothetical protein
MNNKRRADLAEGTPRVRQWEVSMEDEGYAKGLSSSPPRRRSSEDRLDLMKQELDALQVEVMKSSGPWYKQVPVLAPIVIAVLALLFSFATTFVAERRIAREEEHETRVELRELISDLQCYPGKISS